MTALEQAANSIYRQMSAQFFTAGTKQQITDLIMREMQSLVIEQRPFCFTEADESKNQEQALKILKLLKERRSEGATNVELAEVALKYTSRVSDLRKPPHNYVIVCNRESGRVFRYVLHSSMW